jgi:5-methylcytosine-specific restriction endonuclease McrA
MMEIEHVIKLITNMKQTKEKEQHGDKQDKIRAKDLKIPSGFEWFVCRTKFVTNEEERHHLKKGTHGHSYDTISPQEQEEVNLQKMSNLWATIPLLNVLGLTIDDTVDSTQISCGDTKIFPK